MDTVLDNSSEKFGPNPRNLSMPQVYEQWINEFVNNLSTTVFAGQLNKIFNIKSKMEICIEDLKISFKELY